MSHMLYVHMLYICDTIKTVSYIRAHNETIVIKNHTK